jgi:hypothetical protein
MALRYIPFTALNIDETILVLEWRNNPKISKWMYNSSPIELTSHKKFIKKLSIENNKIYWLIKQNKHYAGVCSLTNINFSSKSAEIGIYKNPDVGNVASAGLMLEGLINFSKKKLYLTKLIAETLVNNNRAINFFLKHKFKQIDENNRIKIFERKL